jgi:hypothetical protein
MIQKEYLGDSVYAEWDGVGIVLTTENRCGSSNTIYLEPEVLKALIEYAERTNLAGQPCDYAVEWLLRDGTVSRGATLHPSVEAAEASIELAFRNSQHWSQVWRIVEAVSGKIVKTKEQVAQ